MFTGIIHQTAVVRDVRDEPTLRHLVLGIDWPDVKLGDSIAVNGVCLTVASRVPGDSVMFHAILETLDKSNLGKLKVGDAVHVERALQIGDRLDGHFVLGHVDGVATIVEHRANEDDWRVALRVSPELSKFLAPKGSVTLDGVSLTISALRGDTFEVALIPVTRQITALAKRPVGWPCNFEADILTKSVVNFLERRQSMTEDSASV